MAGCLSIIESRADFVNRGVGLRFETDELVTGFPVYPYQLVELQLYCLRIASLPVLNDEHHHQRKNG